MAWGLLVGCTLCGAGAGMRLGRGFVQRGSQRQHQGALQRAEHALAGWNAGGTRQRAHAGEQGVVASSGLVLAGPQPKLFCASA